MKSTKLIYFECHQVVLVIIVCAPLCLFKEQQSEAVKVSVRNDAACCDCSLFFILSRGNEARSALKWRIFAI